MKYVGRPLSAAAATIGLALVATGCSSNVIGDHGPQPGIAAQVDDTEITIDDVEHVTDAICTLAEADPANLGTTSRAYAEISTLQQWVKAVVATEHAEENGIDVPSGGGLSQIPGWQDLSEDEQEALTEYAETSQAVPAIAEAGEEPDLAEHDVVINPRFDFGLESWEDVGGFEQGVDRLSISVSDQTAPSGEPPTDDELRELPDAQLCGVRPEEQAAPPVPLG